MRDPLGSYLGSVLCKIEALFARERQLADPSLACYRWITKLVISATGYRDDAQCIAGLPGGVVAEITILVIQR